MAAQFTDEQIGRALSNLGHYRVGAAQAVALEGPPDGISGALLLALGLRESKLQNINNKAQTDKGWSQITEVYHGAFLKSEPGCPEGTWRAVEGHSAYEDGYCPRFTPSLLYSLQMLKDNRAYAIRRSLPEEQWIPFAIAAYNCGQGGALRGWTDSRDVDKYTTGADYSAWVLEARKTVHRWIEAHPNWKPQV